MNDQPRSRAPLVALILAGAALVVAAVTAAVVLGRSDGEPSAPPAAGRTLVESRTTAEALVASAWAGPFRADGDSVVPVEPAALGLVAGDQVVAMNGAPVRAPAVAGTALKLLLRRPLEALLLEVVRDGRVTVVRVAIDGDLGAVVAQRGPGRDLSADDRAYPGVTLIDDTHVEIERAAVDSLLANPMAATRGARIMPSTKNGVANGFKIYALRPNSIYAAVGLENGDTVHRVNGMELDSMDRALEVYTQLRAATRLELEVTRRGRPVTLVITVR